MKILHNDRAHIIVATTAFAPFVGGAEVAIQEIITRTSESFRFTVVTARMDARLPAREQWKGVDIIRVGWGSSFDKIWLILILPWHAWRLRRAGNAQLVWAIMASYAGAAACLGNVLVGTPYVLTLQEGDDLLRIEHRLRFVSALFRQIFIRARSVHAIAPFLAAWAKRQGAHDEPLVVPNGVSCEVFSLSDQERKQFRAEVRAKNNIPDSAFVILSVSRLVEKNGIGDLIDAMKLLPDVHALLIGDGKLREELEAQSSSISSRVHFLGTKDQNEIKHFAAAADIFCRPAHSEGQGIAFLEALCLGLPVIATNVGGIPDIITHDVHGILVDPHQPAQLADAISMLQHDTARRSSMERAGLEHVTKFSWDLIVPQIKNWLSSNVK